MSESVIYRLKFPLELKAADGAVTETLTELRLRRLKARDLRRLDGAAGNGSGLVALLGASADLPPSTVDLLDAADATAAGSIVADFLGGFLPTGAT